MSFLHKKSEKHFFGARESTGALVMPARRSRRWAGERATTIAGTMEQGAEIILELFSRKQKRPEDCSSDLP
jgi:hypothetical protein